MRLVFQVVEERIRSGDVVVVEGERGKLEGYFAKSRGRKNVELRDENPKVKKGIKVATVKRERCKKIVVGIEKEENEGEFVKIIGEITSSLIMGREFTEWGSEGGGRSVLFNKISVY